MCLLALGFPHLQVGAPFGLRTVVILSLLGGGIPMCSMTVLFQEGRGLVEFSTVPELTSSQATQIDYGIGSCLHRDPSAAIQLSEKLSEPRKRTPSPLSLVPRNF